VRQLGTAVARLRPGFRLARGVAFRRRRGSLTHDTEWGQYEGAVVDPDGSVIRFGSPMARPEAEPRDSYWSGRHDWKGPHIIQKQRKNH
jgi:hypothetical protein